MNIQISVVIWTVICFLALYFILKYLLFKPLLDVMDKRKAKLTAFAEEKQNAEKRNAEVELKAAARFEELEKQALLNAKQKAQNVRQEGKQKLEEAKKENIAAIESYRKNTESEYAADIKKAAEAMDGIADAFLSSLIEAEA